VRAAGATVGPGSEGQIVSQAHLHHFTGFDRDVTDGRRGQSLPLGRWGRRVLAQHLVDGALSGPFDQDGRGLARLYEQPDAGRGRFVEDATEDCHQPVYGHVSAGFVTGVRLVSLCDVLNQVDDRLIGADRVTQDRYRVHAAGTLKSPQGDPVQQLDDQRAPALVCRSAAEPGNGGA